MTRRKQAIADALLAAVLLVPPLVAYLYLADYLDFVQDDAYITYRYVANYLNGDGLVYNIGERIEGVTNFGWTIYLTLWGALGAGYIAVSRITGLLLGAGTIVLTYLIAGRVLDGKQRWLALLPAYLVGFSPSLAYWSPAGLETAAFAFMTLLAVHLFLKRSRWLLWAILVAVWLRPEGALVAGLLIVVETLTVRRLPRYSLGMAAAAFVLSLPFVVFKVLYYGSLLPNPFYAKTGLHWEHLVSGLEYAGRFFAHYGFYGLGLVVPVLCWRKLSRTGVAVLLIVLLYTAYIVLVGGDVLKVHRFFLPILGLAALMPALTVRRLMERFSTPVRVVVAVLVTAGLTVLTVILPWEWVNTYNYYERTFTRKMSFMADQIERADPSDFSVAVPTIGIFGYELLGHRIIDMVGLTDSTIARHSEPPIKGMETTWKERKHNTRYLLSLAPDYILFSTGIKPSAPAERALFLFPEFINSYRTIGWFYRPDPSYSGTVASVWKKMRPVDGPLEPAYPVEYVQYYKTGLDHYVAGDHVKAIEYYDKAVAVSPEPVNPYVLAQKAFSLMLLARHQEAWALQTRVCESDSLIFEAHRDLYTYAVVMGDTAGARVHETWLRRLVPWYWPRIRDEAAGMLRDAAAREGRSGH